MPQGRARCKECGKLVSAEVEKDTKCPGCGRIFQIPNEPQYTNSNPLRTHSLARLSLDSSLVNLLGMGYSRDSDTPEIQWELPRETRHKNPQVGLLLFPERNEPELMPEQGWLRVIVEFCGHNDPGETEMAINDGNLILQSKLCSYQNTIPLPKGFSTISQVTLKNGILEVKINPSGR